MKFSFPTDKRGLADFGTILGGTLIGAAAGAIGAGVANAAIGGSFLSGQALSAVGFTQGFTSGFAGGLAGGFVGGAGNAWLYGANFWEGVRSGVQAGYIGGFSGGLIGGTISGIRALKNNGNFWNGEGTTLESLATPGQSLDIDKDLEYSNDFARGFSDEHFPDVKGVNKLHADYSVPSKGGYYFKDNVLYNSKGQITNGVTEYVGGGKSNVFLSPSAFSSEKQLFLTMGHEYIHVTQNATLSATVLQRTYKGFKLSEIAAYNWEASLGHNTAYGSWSKYLGVFQWRNNPHYNWLPKTIPF